MFQLINFLAIVVVSAALVYHYYVFFETKKALNAQISDVQSDSATAMNKARAATQEEIKKTKAELEDRANSKITGIQKEFASTKEALNKQGQQSADTLQKLSDTFGKAIKENDQKIKELGNALVNQQKSLSNKLLTDGEPGTNMVRLKGVDGQLFDGFSFGKLRVESDANFDGTLHVLGGTSEHNQKNFRTIFNSKQDNKNYIRGDTEIRGNTNNVGDLRVGRDLDVNRTLWFGQFDTSADYTSLKKVSEKGGKSSLRMTINKDPNDSFEIWGDSCSNKNCQGEGIRQHEFTGSGEAYHRGNLTVDGGQLNANNVIIKGGNVYYNGGNNWLMHAPNDKRTSMWVVPSKSYGSTEWNWDNSVKFDANGTFNVKKICIDDVCIDKNQLKAVMKDAGVA